MYEYGLISEVADVKLEKSATATKDEFVQNLQVALAGVIFRVTEHMKTFQGGGWEIMSHQSTSLDRYLVVSFLIPVSYTHLTLPTILLV